MTRGRKRLLDDDQVQEIRNAWAFNMQLWQTYRSNPSQYDEPPNLHQSDLAARFRVSETLIAHVLDHKGAYAPKENYPGFRITDLWIFVGIDDDDDEGVMAFTTPEGAMPMVAADADRRDQLTPIADEIIKAKGGHYEIRHFVRAADGE